ncbi:UbiD family decarboxylase, partial [Rhodopseudomonas sp. B29]|uniref:UbiD family decarboxylase n=1 Tax=Rhodopseudomonas sp. B29 TaxID=95607 RepID=UPI0004CE1742
MSRAPHQQSMRAFLAALEPGGDMLTVSEPVALEFGVAACLAEADAGPAVYFAAPQSETRAKLPVVGNLLNALPRYARGLGCEVGEIQTRLLAAIDAPLPHRNVDAAPCQDVAIANPSLTDELPIPRFFEQEEGNYITAGLIVALDRVTGQTNLSIARLMPIGGNRAFVGIAPNHHLAVLARAAHARGEVLDIAVCIGNHPAVLLASCLYLGLGDDELP